MKKFHYMVFVTPGKVNTVLADIAEVDGTIESIAPFMLHPFQAQVIMVHFTLENESEEAVFAGLGWLEDTLGPNCEVF